MSRLNKKSIAATFANAAPSYDQSAQLQRDVGEDLWLKLQKKAPIPGSSTWPTRRVDLGCGTGYFTHRLAEGFAGEIIAIDIALPMLLQTRARLSQKGNVRYINGDAENIPLQSASVDMIFSNFVFQWCTHLDEAITECLRILKPGGWLAFSMPGEGTLCELKQSWQQVDGFDHVNSFFNEQTLNSLLSGVPKVAQLKNLEDSVSVSSAYRITQYITLKALLGDLKNIGANRVNGQQSKGLSGKGKYQHLLAAYESFRQADGLLPATYEVLNVIIHNTPNE